MRILVINWNILLSQVMNFDKIWLICVFIIIPIKYLPFNNLRSFNYLYNTALVLKWQWQWIPVNETTWDVGFASVMANNKNEHLGGKSIIPGAHKVQQTQITCSIAGFKQILDNWDKEYSVNAWNMRVKIVSLFENSQPFFPAVFGILSLFFSCFEKSFWQPCRSHYFFLISWPASLEFFF